MVAKLCSRSQGQPEPGVRSAAMISRSREMSREGVIERPIVNGGGAAPAEAVCGRPPLGGRSHLRGTRHAPTHHGDSHKVYYGIFSGDVSLDLPNRYG